MPLIKIIPESIKRNPNAGRDTYHIPLGQEISFSCYDKMPETLKEGEDYMLHSWHSDGKIEGQLLDIDKVNEIKGLKDIELRIENHVQTIRSVLPEREYLYEYENPLLTCLECGTLARLKDIESDSDWDGNEWDVCPTCFATDSFGDIEYENIKDAI